MVVRGRPPRWEEVQALGGDAADGDGDGPSLGGLIFTGMMLALVGVAMHQVSGYKRVASVLYPPSYLVARKATPMLTVLLSTPEGNRTTLDVAACAKPHKTTFAPPHFEESHARLWSPSPDAPFYACEPMLEPPLLPGGKDVIVLVSRGRCDLDAKRKNVGLSHRDGRGRRVKAILVVHDNASNERVDIGVEKEAAHDCFQVSRGEGEELRRALLRGATINVALRVSPGNDAEWGGKDLRVTGIGLLYFFVTLTLLAVGFVLVPVFTVGSIIYALGVYLVYRSSVFVRGHAQDVVEPPQRHARDRGAAVGSAAV